MRSLVPKLHELVGSSASRTVAQLQQLGVDPSDRQVRVAVIVGSLARPAQRLLAATLVDMALRLDPLVAEVIIDSPDEDAMVANLTTQLPIAVSHGGATEADYSIGIGTPARSVDLVADAAGWVAAVGSYASAEDDGNPIGALAGASLTAAEVFKWAFITAYPDRPTAPQLSPWTGAFSFYSYADDGASPALADVRIDTTLIGAGGVGAGFIRAAAVLGPRVSGSLAIVDADVLTVDNLNRVSYATLDAALGGELKVTEATAFLRHHCPHLVVTPYPMTFGTFKRRIPQREDRKYDVIVTGLDNDDARWEVQRDLPRILIDGATGRDMVARVERVEFGRYGCLGCSRVPVPLLRGQPVNCDAPPDEAAPSLSFLSALPGILAAAEVIKEAGSVGGLRGRFDHVFRYGPNPDLVGRPGFRPDCAVGCRRESKLAQYSRKYSPSA
jgi:molybdopterin/thiamine biosynthesis adenylyltransferase